MTDALTAITLEDWAMILTSLAYTRRAFENSPIPTVYPSYGFKQMRLREIDHLCEKIRAIKQAMKAGAA